ncbi:hypothetical protein UT300002_30780 [Clostridium perfringens]
MKKIYKVKDSIYGMSSYLDVDFDENLVAIKVTTCKYGYFRKLYKNELKKTTESVNNNNQKKALPKKLTYTHLPLNDLIVGCKNLLENWLRENKSINENFNIMSYGILNSSIDKLLELVEDSIFFMKLLKI